MLYCWFWFIALLGCLFVYIDLCVWVLLVGRVLLCWCFGGSCVSVLCVFVFSLCWLFVLLNVVCGCFVGFVVLVARLLVGVCRFVSGLFVARLINSVD